MTQEEAKNKKGYCSKCGRKLKRINLGISVPAEPHHPEDVYDGDYRAVFFSFCDKCDKKK